MRSLLEEVGPRNALVGAIVLLALSLLALSLVVVYGVLSSGQEAAERATRGEGITVAPESRPEPPLVFGPGPSDRRLTEATGADGRLRGIPGLGDMDVMGNLKYLPGTNWRCSGPSPHQGLTKQVCRSPSGEDSEASYEVEVVEKNPATVLSVEATAYDATEGEAAEFLVYVARLSLKDTDPINAQAWVGRNVSSGGQYVGDGFELRLYGTEQARTLEIVATGPPTSQVSGNLEKSSGRQQTTNARQPTTTQRK